MDSVKKKKKKGHWMDRNRKNEQLNFVPISVIDIYPTLKWNSIFLWKEVKWNPVNVND